ncbi:VQ motif-containing protein 22-like [Solanum dulcamara]|uniref:VQ motif-containing protein 22-like n=1 Tax=Solanum dulcamara TaxID=45834 RepID=UPI0024853A29|nr:VQ motif-containing protein 22-like [Solanum dulcamara]
MGMSETMPNNPTNWMQFYQPQRSPQTTMFSDTTVVTTTATSVGRAPDHQRGTGPSDGRVSKPIRRRSRASRRTPTTVLNTDTTNFRAMVQQFTGGSVAPSQGAYMGFGPNNQQIVNPYTYNIQFQAQPAPQNQLPYMFSTLASSTIRPPASVLGRVDNFLHRLDDNTSSPSNENKSENNFTF